METKTHATEVKTRRMREFDLASLVDIDEELSDKEGDSPWEARIEAHLWSCSGLLNFVAEHEGKVVGFIFGDIRGLQRGVDVTGWIDMIGVAPQWRGRGVGRLLLDAFHQECLKNGVPAKAIVQPGNEKLASLLTSSGFHPCRTLCYEK